MTKSQRKRKREEAKRKPVPGVIAILRSTNTLDPATARDVQNRAAKGAAQR